MCYRLPSSDIEGSGAWFCRFVCRRTVVYTDIRELEAVAFATVDVEHGKGGDGGTEGGEAEDEHGGGVSDPPLRQG